MTRPDIGRSEAQFDDVSRGTRGSGPYSESRVIWAGRGQARVLAETLSGPEVERAGPNLVASCIESNAALLVLSKPSSFDLCNTAIAHRFDPTETYSIVAAVGGGPHSVLAATVAQWLSQRMGVPASAVCGYSNPSEQPEAERVLRSTVSRLPGMDASTIEAASPAAMVKRLPAGSLLVVGAPGGSWFQRRFFGPGARIRAMASSGTIVVRRTPARIYQVMRDPVAFGPNLRVSDALGLSDGFDVVVAQHGKFHGIVHADALASARPDLELQDVMDDGIFLSPDGLVDEVIDLASLRKSTLVPVVDADERVVGCISAPDLSRVVLG